MINVHGGQRQEIIELPSTYQRVEYLESTGTQYINTNYFVNTKTKIECEFQFTDSTIKQQRVFGSVDSANTRLDCYVKDSLQLGWNWTEQENQTNLNVNTNHTIDTNKHKIVIDGANKTVKLDDIYSSSIAGNLTKTSTTSLTIMAYVRPQAQAFAYLKLYSFKIYDNNVLVRNFVACYRKSDNVAGLYDLVNDVFYTNSGTGTFSVGENKNNVVTPSIENSSEIEAVDNINILQNSTDKVTAFGLTAEIQNDESVKISGKSTSTSQVCLTNVKKIDVADIKEKKYTISCKNVEALSHIGIRLRKNNNGTLTEIDNFKLDSINKSITLDLKSLIDTSTTEIQLDLILYSTSSYDVTLFIKIEKGQKATAYSKYSFGVIEIKSSNKNMLENTAKSINTNGIDYTVYNDGTIMANGTATADATLKLYGDYYIKNNNRIHGNVTLSGCPARRK